MYNKFIETFISSTPKPNHDLSKAVNEGNAERVKQLLESEEHLLANRSESDLSKFDGRFHPKAKKRLIEETCKLAFIVECDAYINPIRKIYPSAQGLKDLDILVMLLNSKPELVDYVSATYPIAHSAVNELTFGLHLLYRSASLDHVVPIDSWSSYIPNFLKSKPESAEDLAEKGYDTANYRSRVINV